MTEPMVSIIIVNWNTRELLRRCVHSVYTTVPPLPFEVFVVDNASEDGSADMVEECFPEVVCIRSQENLGFAKGNNVALHRAAGRYCLLLNPDAELLPGAVQTVVDFLEARPDVAFVGPTLLNPDGTLQKNGRRFPTVMREAMGLTRAYRLLPRIFDRMVWGRDDFEKEAEVDEISGACFMVRKRVVDFIGLMDERYFMYYEEVDWCRRMQQAGWKGYYLPAARVIHHEAKASDQTGIRKFRMAYNSQFHYFRKHHGLAPAVVLRLLSWGLIALIWLKRRIIRKPNEVNG